MFTCLHNALNFPRHEFSFARANAPLRVCRKQIVDIGPNKFLSTNEGKENLLAQQYRKYEVPTYFPQTKEGAKKEGQFYDASSKTWCIDKLSWEKLWSIGLEYFGIDVKMETCVIDWLINIYFDPIQHR